MVDDAESVALAESELLVSTRHELYEVAAAATFFRCIEPQRCDLTADLATASDMAATNEASTSKRLVVLCSIRCRSGGLGTVSD
jgi:hypothetical protein